jgi:hypothetical protein
MPPVVVSPLLEVPNPHPVAAFAPDGEASVSAPRAARARARKPKPRCEDCFFHQNMLCALPDKKPCPTFRLAHPDGLKPPQQLSFVFRQERRAEPFVFQPARV